MKNILLAMMAIAVAPLSAQAGGSGAASGLAADSWNPAGFHAPVSTGPDLMTEAGTPHPNLDRIDHDSRAYPGNGGVRHLEIPHSEGWLRELHSNSQKGPGDIDHGSRLRVLGDGGIEYRFSKTHGLVTDGGHRKIFFGPRISF